MTSLRGCRYYVSFTDDFLRFTWLYFISHKFDVLEKFKVFKDLFENQMERKVKALRKDNGGEFCSHQFNQFCVDYGIARQKKTPYTLQ